ncbi:MAG: hypothetical protein KM310_00025 [Clostridiales bacterium]|nr:hypothetical protein [Clostridiales bacterium]
MRRERAQSVVFIAVALMALILMTVFVLVIGTFAVGSEEVQSWTDAAVTGVFYDRESINIQYRFWRYDTTTVYRDPQDPLKPCDPSKQTCLALILRKKTSQCTEPTRPIDDPNFYAPDSDPVDSDPCGADVTIDPSIAESRMQGVLIYNWFQSGAESRGFGMPSLASPPKYACEVTKPGQDWLVTITVGIKTVTPLQLTGAELLGRKGPVEVTRKASSDTELRLPGTIRQGQLAVFLRDQTHRLCHN